MNSTDRFSTLHEKLILRHPVVTLVIIAVLTAFFAWHAQYFGLDASADSLTLERDEALGYYRMTKARYGSDDYLIVTFAPQEELFSEPGLQRLRELRADLSSLDSVESVISILDVPLIRSPPVDLRRIAEGL
ncbi:MAG: transporter, partial [Gammaproteobacteria bacterium]|nr:transporter [Gammaproteobacteria bacterium]